MSDELAAAVAEWAEARRRRDAAFAASHADDSDAVRVSDILDQVAQAPDLRKRAELVIRCQDCNGLTIAHVTYVRERPMLWTRQPKGPGCRMWLDGTFWGDVAHCRRREYALHAKDLLEYLATEDREREARLTH